MESSTQVDEHSLQCPIATSHDGPDRADEGENLGFDSWIVPKTSNSLVHTKADWRRRGRRSEGKRRKQGERERRGPGHEYRKEKGNRSYAERIVISAQRMMEIIPEMAEHLHLLRNLSSCSTAIALIHRIAYSAFFTAPSAAARCSSLFGHQVSVQVRGGLELERGRLAVGEAGRLEDSCCVGSEAEGGEVLVYTAPLPLSFPLSSL
ncbi:hypothetical protein EYF80_003454 [Liparis tanakae]|uniref:Uncharacterized protein n=1 Tax=Liparis tanakae TaxID=230148 RepID=A0A4Z2J866_9TELE|nr:hypothetical protein EYF80_003454 [Liparis tanakae]